MAGTAVLPQPAVTVRALSTPQVLWRTLWVLWICDVVMLAGLLYAGHVHRVALQTIGRDSAPSIIAAQAIKASLADMDANAAKELASAPGTVSDAGKIYTARRQQAAAALIAAAQNITYGEAEHAPILAIQLGIGKYEALLQRARDLHEEKNKTFLDAYAQAAKVLDQEILPAADQLDAANDRELEAAYSRQREDSVSARTAFSLAAMVFLVTLLGVQMYLYRKTRRLLNLPLVAASVLVFIFLFNRLDGLTRNEAELKRAKEDAFASIHSVWRAWALAYSANGDQIKIVLDPGHAAEHRADFERKRDQIARLAAGATYDTAGTNLGGYLGEELNNVTFAGEGEAAQDAVRTFGAFATAANSGDREKTFAQFSQSMSSLLKINKAEFDKSVDAGFATLSDFELKAGVVSAVAALLVMGGLMQRIREYR